MAFLSPGPSPLSCDPRADSLPLLLAPLGQLSADGQLRELIGERRDRRNGTGPIWYLPPELVAALGLGQGSAEEAVVTTDAAVLTWLQLRFGGRRCTASLSTLWLDREAKSLPPSPRLARLA